MTNDLPHEKPWRDMAGPAIVALVALVAVVLTIDAAGDYPALFEGPGITLDESFNVQMGVYQWHALRDYNLALLHPDSVREVFGPGTNYLPDHPPLGRLWLGIWHDLILWLFPPSDHPPDEHGVRFVTDCARFGSATAFALTVFLIGFAATKWYGCAAGIIAAMSLVLMPRVFAHAHLAALETCMNLAYAATILAVAHWWTKPFDRTSQACVPESGNRLAGDARACGVRLNEVWRVAVLTGVLFGLALLTKIQAVLIPPVVGLWALWNWRSRAIVPLALFGLVGFVAFFLGWQWLWIDPLPNLHRYFASTTNRAVLHCYYLGQAWADKDVPWHYPFVMFAVTVPVGLHALGLLGVFGKGRVWRQPREQLLIAAVLFPLVLFAIPGVAVYDGERLFSISYPIWAVLIGRGTMIATNWLGQSSESPSEQWLTTRSSRRVAVAALVVLQAIGVVLMHPCQLSYYNLLVGGLTGADKLGFERTYWGDSLTRSFLKDVVRYSPHNALVEAGPVLHQFQLPELQGQSPILRNHGVRFATYTSRNSKTLQQAQNFMLFSRKADLARIDWGDDWSFSALGIERSGVRLAHSTISVLPDRP